MKKNTILFGAYYYLPYICRVIKKQRVIIKKKKDMKVTGFFTTPEVKSTKQNYKPTTLDNQKKQADLLVTAIDDKYTLFINNSKISITGRGVKSINEKVVECTEKAYESLAKKYTILFDL